VYCTVVIEREREREREYRSSEIFMVLSVISGNRKNGKMVK
jgi:hypothetical protein